MMRATFARSLSALCMVVGVGLFGAQWVEMPVAHAQPAQEAQAEDPATPKSPTAPDGEASAAGDTPAAPADDPASSEEPAPAKEEASEESPAAEAEASVDPATPEPYPDPSTDTEDALNSLTEPAEAPRTAPPASSTTPTTKDAATDPSPASEASDNGSKTRQTGTTIDPTEDPGEEQLGVREVSYGDITSTFTFASYGRVRAASNLDGGRARPINVVTHGSRIDELNYAELEFQKLFEWPKSADELFFMQMVATLALGDDLFHFTGDFDQTIATRNLYAEGGWKLNDLLVSFWAGSRMYRGDDIYLLDFWALDNLNTVGGGGAIAYDWKGFGRSELKLHAGASRLTNDFQFQRVPVPGFEFGADEVVFLNRQRTISTARLQQDVWLNTRPDGSPTAGVKVVLYGEDHSLPEGTRRIPDTNEEEVLPAEDGVKLGTELGIWRGEGFFAGTFANLFYVYSQDLAAYGEFGVPTGINLNETSEGARQHLVGLSADIETPYAGMLIGSYYKYFQDADRDDVDFDDYWEAIFAARAHWYATEHIHPGVEVSYQVREPQGPFAGTNEFEVPTVTKLSFIQALTMKRGMYSRPQLRFIYTLSLLNESAVALFPTDDPRRDDVDATNGQLTTHYLGVMVEWWFNNASLFRP